MGHKKSKEKLEILIWLKQKYNILKFASRALPLPLPRCLLGSESGGGTGCGVADTGGCRLRTVGPGLLRLQGGQHPGQDGVAGEAPRLCVPGGEHG